MAKQLCKLIKRQLRAAGTGDDTLEAMAESIVDLMKRRRGR